MRLQASVKLADSTTQEQHFPANQGGAQVCQTIYNYILVFTNSKPSYFCMHSHTSLEDDTSIMANSAYGTLVFVHLLL